MKVGVPKPSIRRWCISGRSLPNWLITSWVSSQSQGRQIFPEEGSGNSPLPYATTVPALSLVESFIGLVASTRKYIH